MGLYLRLPRKSLGRYCQLLSKLEGSKSIYKKRVQIERVVYRKRGDGGGGVGSNLLHTTVPNNLIKGSEMQRYNKSFSRKNPNKNYVNYFIKHPSALQFTKGENGGYVQGGG